MKIPLGKRGFTLIEILVVTSIISLLSSVVITATTGAREKAEVANGQRFDRNVMSVLADNLVAEWTFEDPTSLGADTSGFNQNIIANPNGDSAAIPGTGKRNSSNFVTCVSGKVCFGTPSSSNFSFKKSDIKGYTISAWVRTSALETQRIIYADWDTAQANGFLLLWNLDGTISFYQGSGARSVATQVLKPNQWYNIVATFKSDASGDKASIYVNGKLANTATLSGSAIPIVQDHRFSIQHQSKTSVRDVDDVRIYTSALSELVVEDLYNVESRIARK